MASYVRKYGLRKDADELQALNKDYTFSYERLSQTRIQREKMRLVSRENEHKFNIKRLYVPGFSKYCNFLCCIHQKKLKHFQANWYHSLLEYSWWKLLLGLCIYYILV